MKNKLKTNKACNNVRSTLFNHTHPHIYTFQQERATTEIHNEHKTLMTIIEDISKMILTQLSVAIQQ